MTEPSYIAEIKRMGACYEALAWLRKEQPPTLGAAWATCPRGDWLLWYAGEAGAELVLLVHAAAACARTALRHTTDPRVAATLDVVDRWCHGSAILGEVRVAWGAMEQAARAQVGAASWAALAAEAAAGATAQAEWSPWEAAEQAALAAEAEAWATARDKNAAWDAAEETAATASAAAHRELADIVRSIIPCPVPR